MRYADFRKICDGMFAYNPHPLQKRPQYGAMECIDIGINILKLVLSGTASPQYFVEKVLQY